MKLPHHKLKMSEIKKSVMKSINIKKPREFDLITDKVVQELLEKCFKLITNCKVTQSNMILKPGKGLKSASSRISISFLPNLSKLFEKIYGNILVNIIQKRNTNSGLEINIEL